MATINQNQIDDTNLQFTVVVSKEDYKVDLDKELKKYRQQAQLKGFRKGKTPMTVVRKMFGRQVLGQVVNDKLQEAVTEFLYEGDDTPNFLGQPIPSENQADFEFNINELDDYQFSFDLGIAPAFEVQGLDGNAFEYLNVEPDDKMLEEELENLLKRFGANEELEEGTVEGNDIITLGGVELVDGKPKKDGLNVEFTVFLQQVTESANEALLGKNVGDTAELNVFEIEKNSTEEQVRKYMLKLEGEDMEREISDLFALTIKKIARNKPAELNEEFFKQAFGEGDVTNEAEAKEKIRDDYRKHFLQQSGQLFMREVQNQLFESNELNLPDTFLQRWLVYSNENNTPESVEAGYESFRKGLTWTLIREKLVGRFELKVEREELEAHFATQVQGYFGGQMPEWMNEEFIQNMVERMMGEEKQVREAYDQLLDGKLIEALKEATTLQERTVTPQEMNDIVQKIQAEIQAEQALLDEEE